jgi:nucleobase:cation symporter-1, NCS1 family
MELGGPVLALLSLLLVAFANIGTQGMGSYIYGLVLKSAFPKTDYRVIAIILCLYVSGLTLWGKVVEYFGAFISLSACIYGPIMALLFVDYFFIRKQKISLRSAYGVQGFNAYKYHKGFNLIGLACVIVGTLIGLLVYDPLTATIKSPVFYFLTASGTSFFATAIIYYVLSKIPYFSKYILKDRNELTISKNS